MRSGCVMALLALFLSHVYSQGLYGFAPIPSTHYPYVIEFAKFAVSEYNKKTTDKLAFERLVKGKYTSGTPIYYVLVIAAKNESLPNIPSSNYEATLTVGPIKTLDSFRKIYGLHAYPPIKI
ncbi:hypothetical protein TB2_009332 [Malus domestica]|uniref:Cystatin domain-containing protein n=1 Tax=Malus domestica TaxID=3750 RepID=A0A498IFD3_MALDO|nr:hypothetical protein DVH24_004581 [Malus domestica]